jgi:hypothetical protein
MPAAEDSNLIRFIADLPRIYAAAAVIVFNYIDSG